MENKFIFGIIFAFLISLSLVETVSAIDWDNVKSYDSNSKTITITNFFGLGSEVATYKLTDNTLMEKGSQHSIQCLINCELNGETKLNYDGALFSDLDFKNKIGTTSKAEDKQTSISILVPEAYDYSYWTYTKKCTSEVPKNSTDGKLIETCIDVPDKEITEKRTREVWQDYKIGEILKAGTHDWKINFVKKPSESLDLSVGMWGISADSVRQNWVWYDANWGYKQNIQIASTETILENYTIDIELTGNANMSGWNDIRFTNGAENAELGYWFYNNSNTYLASGAGEKINVSINVSSVTAGVNTSIYMYYGNPAVSTTSNISKAFMFGDDFGGSALQSGLYKQTGGTYVFKNGIMSHIETSTAFVYLRAYTSCNNKYQKCQLNMMTTRKVDNGYQQSGWDDPSGAAILFYNDGTKYYSAYTSGWNHVSRTTDYSTGWFELKIEVNQTADARFYENGVLKTTFTSQVSFQNFSFVDLVRVGNNSFDWVFMRSVPQNPNAVTYSIGEETIPTKHVVNMNSPVDNHTSPLSIVTFDCNATSDIGVQNLTLMINNTNVYTVNGGADQNLSISQSISLGDGAHTWKCIAFDISGYNVNGTQRNLLVITGAPLISVTTPTNNYIYTNTSDLMHLVYTINSPGIDTCWYQNLTGINSTVPCGGPSNFTIPNFGVDYTLKIYANDSAGNVAKSFINITAVNTTGTQTYPATSLESVLRTFDINVNRSSNVTITPHFIYNGASYSGITALGNYYNKSLTIPLLTGTNPFQAIPFNWTFDMSYLGGPSQTATSATKTLNVYQVYFGLCNPSQNVTASVLNITFVDETSGLPMSATMDASTWAYIIEGASKSFLFSNTTHNVNYEFCVYPNYVSSVVSTETLQYSSSEGGTYPQRKVTFTNETYYNSTVTNKTLYLLDINHGITSTFQVINIGNQVIQGAYIKVERTIGGSTVTIADGYTDSAGTTAFFLNPNYDHTITVSKAGYLTQTQTIKPSSSTYTITLGGISNYFVYTEPLEGITYTIWPPSGLIQDGVYNFSLAVHSRSNNVYNCSFYIRYMNGTIINSVSGCNDLYPFASNGGKIAVMINVTGIDQLKGSYYITTLNGTFALEGDARWKNVLFNASSGLGIISALNDTYNLPEWGDNPQTTDYSRIVFFFLAFSIILAALNFFTGYDTAYPGAFIYIITIIVVMLSAINGIAGPGWFYLHGATNAQFFCGKDAFGNSIEYCSFSQIIDNWILSVHFVLLSLIYFFTTNKRYSSG